MRARLRAAPEQGESTRIRTGQCVRCHSRGCGGADFSHRTGIGDACCAGPDLAPAERDDVDTGRSAQQHALDEYGWVGRFLLTFRLEVPKPIVAGVNGVAVGAGLASWWPRRRRSTLWAAVAAATWLAQGGPPEWPTGRLPRRR